MSEVKYRVVTEAECSEEYSNIEDALKEYESAKDYEMAEGVVVGETNVDLESSKDDFENVEIVKRAVAVIDEEMMKLEDPKIGGWDYWAKWEESEAMTA